MDSNVRSRKRKDVEEDEDDEETKMEKFFGLIERLREARERLIRDHNGWACLADTDKNDNNSIKNKKKKQVMIKGCAWEPRFQLEDFAQEPKDIVCVAFNNTGKAADRHHHHHHHQKQETTQGQGLDLRLSL